MTQCIEVFHSRETHHEDDVDLAAYAVGLHHGRFLGDKFEKAACVLLAMALELNRDDCLHSLAGLGRIEDGNS